jgi:hypothetical protein
MFWITAHAPTLPPLSLHAEYTVRENSVFDGLIVASQGRRRWSGRSNILAKNE